ncbi:actin-domain-containing protein [Melampsora americana]|nr:actin-domain-containing protein [Melampsora americana]
MVSHSIIQSSGFRDANLLIISLSTHSHSIQAGLGLSPEAILPPTHSLTTEIYLPESLKSSDPTRRWSDYSLEPKPGYLPQSLFTDSGDGTGQSVVDWKALDAFFRHLLFTSLKLSNPPLAQHILLSIPPSISNVTRDKLTQLFFENLQAPALFLADSGLLHILASNRSSGISVDLGTHSTLLSFIHDSILLRHCSLSFPLGEVDCDNYLIALLLTHDTALPERLCPSPGDRSPKALYQALCSLVTSLKTDGHIRFQPELSDLVSALPNTSVEEDENAITDVAQAIVSGKVDKLLGRQPSGGGASASSSLHSRRGTAASTANAKKLEAELLVESDTIIVSVPTSDASSSPTRLPTEFGTVQIPNQVSAAELRIGKFRHRHAEPLFSPSVLSLIPSTFAQHGLEAYASRYTPEMIEDAGDGITAAAQTALRKIDGGQNQRREVSEHLILTGQGGIMCRTEGLAEVLSKALGSKPAKVPDYFSEFKSRPELLGFLGGAIVAKLIFNDASASKLWMSKPDYSREGPYVSRKIGEAPGYHGLHSTYASTTAAGGPN